MTELTVIHNTTVASKNSDTMNPETWASSTNINVKPRISANEVLENEIRNNDPLFCFGKSMK